MSKFNVFKRKKKIENELQRIRYEDWVLHKELKVLQKECNHEITVTVENKDLGISKIRTYCLLCGAHLTPRKYLPEELLEKMLAAVNINITKNMLLEEELGKRYEKLKEKNWDKTEYEIGEMLKKELNA
ncbi:MAG: hypothetical protein IJ223_05925 [Clostridia bacterium]|nr:hypothetical protein [Clostridia bacterium]